MAYVCCMSHCVNVFPDLCNDFHMYNVIVSNGNDGQNYKNKIIIELELSCKFTDWSRNMWKCRAGVNLLLEATFLPLSHDTESHETGRVKWFSTQRSWGSDSLGPVDQKSKAQQCQVWDRLSYWSVLACFHLASVFRQEKVSACPLAPGSARV